MFITAVIAVCAVFFTSGKTASADTDDELPAYPYETHVRNYDITIDVDTDRSLKIVEDIGVYFFNNAAIIRDIPVNAGERIMNVKAYEMVNGQKRSVIYSVLSEKDDDDNEFISVDIGGYATKYKELHTYRIEYDYCLTKAQEGNDLLALTPVGAGWPCPIYDIDITLILPDGYIMDEKTFCEVKGLTDFYGTDIAVTEGVTDNGKATLSAHIDYIKKYTQVRFDVHFKEGVLSTYTDFTPYICVIAGAVLFLLLIALKFLVCNNDKVVPVVNFEAPNQMDPLMMGKLIDSKVDTVDIASLIYYFADKGYLKINFEDKDNPTLIRVVKELPESCEDYEKTTFNKLFSRGDSVRVGGLKNYFYSAIPSITGSVNSKAGRLYSGKGKAAAVAFTILSLLLFCLSPVIIALMRISLRYSVFDFVPLLFAIVPAVIVFTLSLAVKQRELKLSKIKQILIYSGIFALGFLISLLYLLIVPSAIMPLPVALLMCAICVLTVTASVMTMTKTEEYTKKLNDIIGFKNYIKLVEKKELETMLEQDPQYYYHILPYAQVLGVSKIWEEKFQDIAIEPPQWGVTGATVIEFYVLNRMISSSVSSLSKSMASHPSSSGSSGSSGWSSGGGSSFGGHSGGGHGGGGGRFR